MALRCVGRTLAFLLFFRSPLWFDVGVLALLLNFIELMIRVPDVLGFWLSVVQALGGGKLF